MSSGVALLEEPALHPRPSSVHFGLTAAGVQVTVPLSSVREIAETGALHPLPLANSPVIGLVEIGGHLTACVETARLFAMSPGSGRFVVVVATGCGDLALTAERTDREGEGEPLDLAIRLAWTGGFAPVRRTAAAVPVAPTVPLMLIQSGDRILALRSERLERIARVESIGALSDDGDPRDRLVSVAGELIAARSLGSLTSPNRSYALILRNDDGEQVALLVERAIGVERCELARIFAVRHPDGERSVWWDSLHRGPVKVIDPSDLFGWLPRAPLGAENTGKAGADVTARPDLLFVELSGATVAIPLPQVERVLESPPAVCRQRDGVPLYDLRLIEGGKPARPARAWLSLKGFGGLLAVDGILPLDATTMSWQPLGGLPPASALLFDSAGWHPERKRWVLRLKDGITGLADWKPLRRALAGARIGWTVSQ